jgi:hypothetical protein
MAAKARFNSSSETTPLRFKTDMNDRLEMPVAMATKNPCPRRRCPEVPNGLTREKTLRDCAY